MLPYSEAGTGPTIVLLHAGICDRTMWDDHLEPIAAGGFHAIAFDLPGFGEATPDEGVQRPWIDVLVALDELGITSAAIAGSSFGGAVALRAAITLPHRFWAMSLCSAPAPGTPPSPELLAAWEAEEAALAEDDIDAAVEAIVDAWTRPGDDAVRERVDAMQRRSFELQGGLLEVGEPIDPAEQDGALEGLLVPATISSGTVEFADFIAGADAMASRLPRAQRHTFDGAGHLAPLEQPEAYREHLLAHLTAARGT